MSEQASESPPFEALAVKHWKLIGIIISAISSVFFMGIKYAKSQSGAKLSENAATIGQLQLKLQIAEGKNDKISEAYTKLAGDYKELSGELKSRNVEIAGLSATAKGSNTCEFIKSEILSIEHDLKYGDGIGSVIFDSSQEYKEKQTEERLALARTLNIYQARLDSCK